MKSGIYAIRHLATNRLYVGSSINVKHRWTRHKNNCKAKRHHCKHLQSAWHKYGEQAFEFEVLEYVEADMLLEREQYWMDKLKPAFNDCPVAGRPTGRKHSDEAKAKMAAARTGRKLTAEHKANIAAGLKGRVVSEETRAKIGAKHKGKTVREESKEGSRIANTGNKYSVGRVASAETRAKISAVQKGKPKKPFSAAHREAISKAAKDRYARIGVPIRRIREKQATDVAFTEVAT